jgi:polar amino acid transport system permease protein
MNQTTFRTVEIFSLLLVMYLGISLLITLSIRMLEARASAGLTRGRAG